MESHLTGRWLSPKNALFNGRCLFLWLANTGVEPPFSKLAGSNYKSYWPHVGQVKRKVNCGKFSLEFNSIRIAAHKDWPALQHAQIHVEKWIPPLCSFFNKSPAKPHAKQEFRAVTINTADGSTLGDNLITSHQV